MEARKRILIVDDEAKIRELLKKYASFEGYDVDEASDGQEAVEKCRKEDYDLIVMDVMMPFIDGFTACREIRKTKSTPVIMLSARGEEYDKIHGFEVGVDDYVVKPFSPKELMMRISAVLKRTERTSKEEAHETQTFEGLTVDFTGRMVFVDGAPVELTPKEYELLFYLVRNRKIALSREKLLNDVWGYDFYGDDRTLDTHIKLLRKSLGNYAKLIVTLRGVGYRFDG